MSPLSGGNVHEPSSCSSNDLFEDWPEANDMAVSVYVTLTVEALGALVPTTDAPLGRWKSNATGSSTR
jgi:hypothetical protein